MQNTATNECEESNPFYCPRLVSISLVLYFSEIQLCTVQIVATSDVRSGLLVEDLRPLCPLWTGQHRFTNAEVENHFSRVKANDKSGQQRKSLDQFVLSRYKDMKHLLNRAVS
jgi:hypothetical protein